MYFIYKYNDNKYLMQKYRIIYTNIIIIRSLITIKVIKFHLDKKYINDLKN